MRRMHFLPVFVVAVTLAGIFGCEREALDTHAADEQAIRTAEIEAVRALTGIMSSPYGTQTIHHPDSRFSKKNSLH